MQVKAQDLTIGETLKTQYGTATLSQRLTLETKTTVYNLEVYQDHNYLVSQDRLLVHNNGCGPKAGNYNDLSYDGSKQHGHHMPSKKATGTTDGPAIVMDKADHYQTGSYGGGSRADYRSAQSDLIDGGNYRGAFEMDMKDIRDKFGPKYEKRIRQAAKYAAKQGLL